MKTSKISEKAVNFITTSMKSESETSSKRTKTGKLKNL